MTAERIAMIAIGIVIGFLFERCLPDFWTAKSVMNQPWFSKLTNGSHRIVFVVSIDYWALRQSILYDPKADHDTSTPIIQSWIAPDLDPDTRYVIRKLVWPENFIDPNDGARTYPPDMQDGKERIIQK